MKFTLYGISALEYWRLIGSSDVVVPKLDRLAVSGEQMTEGEIIKELRLLPGIQSLSLPIHIGTVAKRSAYHRDVLHFHVIGEHMLKSPVLSIAGNVGLSSPEGCLLQIAGCVELPELIGLMHEFCGFYSPAERLIQRDPLTSLTKLTRASKRLAGTRGAKKFCRALAYVRGPSRSPMETALALFLSLPYSMGGYSFSDLQLNSKEPLDSFSRRNTGVKTLEPDILFPSCNLCIEYDGRSFHEGQDAVRRDARRINLLTLNGYTVITLVSSQLMSCKDMHETALAIARVMGKRLQIRDQSRFIRERSRLRGLLLGSENILRTQKVDQKMLAERKV